MIKLENISFDHCIKCTVCNIYCPVARVTHLFPGPKQSGPDLERLRIKNPELVEQSLKYCTNCKRCEISCPSDVKIANIIQEAKWKYAKVNWFRPRDFFMSRTDFVGKIAIRFSPIINFFLKLLPVKLLMDLFLNIPFRAKMPPYAFGNFSSWYKKQQPEQMEFQNRVTYFRGCYVNYNNHALGRDLIMVMNRMNTGVHITDEKCCGVPLIANGYLKRAKKNAGYNINKLINTRLGAKIVTTSSSCAYALKHEYAHLLEMDNTALYDDIEYITKFILSEFEKGNIPHMNPVNIRAAYHAPCHLERQGGVIYTIDVLKRVPGLDLVILNSECCGIAGTYGFKSEYYAIASEVGSILFSLIEKADPEIIITDCETCAMQIEAHTQYRVLHPINILAMSMTEKK